MIVLWFLSLFFFLFILLKSADYFIDNSVVLGNKLNIPSFVLGATVIAFGTSLPELAVGLSAIMQDKEAIISGTVIGSNISNIFFILGVALIISSGFKVSFKENASALVILALVTGISSYFLFNNEYTFVEGIISVVLLALYIVYIVLFPAPEDDEDETEDTFSYKTLLLILASGFGIWAGAEMVIVSIKKIAEILSLKEDIISLTIVALGTSLPELAVTISAVKKGKYTIVLGNIIGSNIFNSLCVLGIPVVVGALAGHEYKINDAIFTQFSIPLMLFATLLLLILSIVKTTPRWVGFLFVAFYIYFIVGTFLGFSIIP